MPANNPTLSEVSEKDKPETFSVRIDSIKSARYSINDVKSHLINNLEIQNGFVKPSIAAQIERLLEGRKSDVLILNDGSVAKLYISNSPDKGINLQQIDVQSKLTLSANFLGHKFSETDKENLTRYGNMGRPVDLVDKFSEKPFKGYIGVDKETNKLTVLRADKFRIPDSIKGVVLNAVQKQMLIDGKALRLHNLKGKNNEPFDAYVRIHAGIKNLHFDKIDSTKNQQKVGKQAPVESKPTLPAEPVKLAQQPSDPSLKTSSAPTLPKTQSTQKVSTGKSETKGNKAATTKEKSAKVPKSRGKKI